MSAMEMFSAARARMNSSPCARRRSRHRLRAGEGGGNVVAETVEQQRDQPVAQHGAIGIRQARTAFSRLDHHARMRHETAAHGAVRSIAGVNSMAARGRCVIVSRRNPRPCGGASARSAFRNPASRPSQPRRAWGERIEARSAMTSTVAVPLRTCAARGQAIAAGRNRESSPGSISTSRHKPRNSPNSGLLDGIVHAWKPSPERSRTSRKWGQKMRPIASRASSTARYRPDRDA